MAAIKVHKFDWTGDAYDACQCGSGITDGDVLLCEREGVVGIAGCWPIAVTRERGELHTYDPNAELSFAIPLEQYGNYRQRAMEGFFKARSLAEDLGFELND